MNVTVLESIKDKMKKERQKQYLKEIERLQKRVLEAIDKGQLHNVPSERVVMSLLKYVNKLHPLKKISGEWGLADYKIAVLDRERRILDFLLNVGIECCAYLDSPDVMCNIGEQWQKHVDKWIDDKNRKSKDLIRLKSDRELLCEEYLQLLGNPTLSIDELNDLNERVEKNSQEIKMLENDIKRKEISVPDLQDFLGKGEYVEEVDHVYILTKKKVWEIRNYSNIRKYWKALKTDILVVFPEIDWNRMFKLPEDEYLLHIPIEQWWWESVGSQPRIEALYYSLINRGWINNVGLSSFLRVFSFPINIKLWSKIEWKGKKASRGRRTQGNVTSLYYLISALRNWEWFQENCDRQRNPDDHISRQFYEILTEEDREKICKFFKIKGDGDIQPNSLKFAKDCSDSLFSVEDCIKDILQ